MMVVRGCGSVDKPAMMKTMVFLLLRSDGGSDGRQDDGVSFVEKWRWRQRLGFRCLLVQFRPNSDGGVVQDDEYRPNWGFISFLADFLRPVPSGEAAWINLLKKAGGGCNDLLCSGHMLCCGPYSHGLDGSIRRFEVSVYMDAPARGESSDLLHAEEEKNDYEWLLTPPDTPLFPSLDDEVPQVNVTQRGRPRTQSISISRSSTMNSH